MASLADRITKPDADLEAQPEIMKTVPPPVGQTESSPWADEASTAAGAASAPSEAPSKAEKEKSSLAAAQTDGATIEQGGEGMTEDPSYDVTVRLADLQANPNDPLYSVKSFEQLGL